MKNKYNYLIDKAGALSLRRRRQSLRRAGVYILSFFVILISLYSCKKTELNTQYKQDIEIFSPVLKKEILRMIKTAQFKVCNVAILQDVNRNDSCSVMISLNNSILKKAIKFIPPTDSSNIQMNHDTEIRGYTFIENYLIFCYVFSGSCNDNLINTNKLISYNDSIPGYPDAVEDSVDMISENPMCIYKIVDDSLLLIKSEWLSWKEIE